MRAAIILYIGTYKRGLIEEYHDRGYIPVQVVEERKEIEAKFKESFLFVSIQCAENFCRIEHVVFVDNSAVVICQHSFLPLWTMPHLRIFHATRGRLIKSAIHSILRRTSTVRKACAACSGRMNCSFEDCELV